MGGAGPSSLPGPQSYVDYTMPDTYQPQGPSSSVMYEGYAVNNSGASSQNPGFIPMLPDSYNASIGNSYSVPGQQRLETTQYYERETNDYLYNPG